ncbi:MAG: hypothetical protein QOF31_4670, partial [Mycobacterium sp.]|nr:hypothetical protein [Mycobacterium sp.]
HTVISARFVPLSIPLSVTNRAEIA